MREVYPPEHKQAINSLLHSFASQGPTESSLGGLLSRLGEGL